jgi:hypothetical protein
MVSAAITARHRKGTDISAAEDNPTNDYPDEELSSDDEFDRNPYQYYRGRQSDQYDDDDEDYNEDISSYESRHKTGY